MKPLVYYCRWQGASLRLQGRNATAVWGYLVFTENDQQERLQKFHYHLKNQQINLTQPDNSQQTLQLDDMGVVTTTIPTHQT